MAFEHLEYLANGIPADFTADRSARRLITHDLAPNADDDKFRAAFAIAKTCRLASVGFCPHNSSASRQGGRKNKCFCILQRAN
ncbi:hypothetical protein R70006_06261 [Paraburkholderia domus]|nr:hypothetical protein R70006_06261 [Paraburkholderia domus]